MSNYRRGGMKSCRPLSLLGSGGVEGEGEGNCGVLRIRNEQTDLFRAAERENQMYSSRVTMTEG